MTRVWIPVCPSCGTEDWGITAMGPSTVKELLARLRCRACEGQLEAKEVTGDPRLGDGE